MAPLSSGMWRHYLAPLFGAIIWRHYLAPLFTVLVQFFVTKGSQNAKLALIISANFLAPIFSANF